VQNTSAESQLNNQMYNTSRISKNMFKMKQPYMQPGSPLRSLSPLNASRTSSEWHKTKWRQGRASTDDVPYLIAPVSIRNEQAGSVSAFARTSNVFDSPKPEVKRELTESGNQNNVSQPDNKIIVKQEQRKNKFLKKYSKESLLKSIKKSENSNSKHALINHQPRYIDKVSFLNYSFCSSLKDQIP
jgi:hypothetical protein